MKSPELIIEFLKKCPTESPEEKVKLDSIISDLENDLRKAYAKTAGKQNVKKVIDSILKESRKSYKPVLHYAFKNNNGRTYISDSYRAIELKNTDGLLLEENPDKGMTPPNMEIIMKDSTNASETVPTDVLKNAIALAKQKSSRQHKFTAVYKLENGCVLSADYLLDGITATGSDTVKYIAEKEFGLARFESKDKNTVYIVCPMRVGKTPFDENGIGYFES